MFESDGNTNYAVTVAKSGSRYGITPPPPTEVDIPFIVNITGGTASFDEGIHDKNIKTFYGEKNVLYMLFQRLHYGKPCGLVYAWLPYWAHLYVYM